MYPSAMTDPIREEVAGRTRALKDRGVQPHLSIILVGEDPASQVYTKHKVNDSTETGLAATLERYPATMTEAELLERIRAAHPGRQPLFGPGGIEAEDIEPTAG